ncbi:hypothetical protein MGYG_08942 [Nannizzia gypsea CBS 118893]|uniref:Yos1-like protein n=1 Tax=Arthroderma gypseum (strain ATCC MYA-4604 / CBS 118893) TaxID=535722 RepID=E5R270_ARTGP|nr:hypothetical protein MGYG_08942 [Nannizzia gypsea CBS 118893]EFQ98634.1 hypothetical protein MGYG_08942 [Nannizzia gypsea CBS 118893]
MFFFGLGKLFQVVILIINAIAILSEDRFLARIGWSRTQHDAGFGATHDSTSIKAKSADLIASVRTVMRIPLIAINMLVIFYELRAGAGPYFIVKSISDKSDAGVGSKGKRNSLEVISLWLKKTNESNQSINRINI